MFRSTALTVSIQNDAVDEDIKVYVGSIIASDASLSVMNDALKQEVMDRIAKGSHGM